MRKLVLVFYHDAGHGWLRVPKVIVDQIGSKVSCYSYFNPRDGMAYLEEDLDAPKFVNAAEKFGWEIATIDENLGDDCFIRDLPSFF